MPINTNRRKFIQASATAGIGYWVAGGVASAQTNSPNERIQFACVGIGGKGSSDSKDAARAGQVVAVCDVDGEKLEGAAVDPRFKNAAPYYDFRRMLDEQGDKIDAVTVSTPDHTHAVAAVMAMKMGKHTFCQKPLAHSLHEARVMTETARDSGVATMMGNQGTSFPNLRKASAILQSGVLGNITDVHVWTNRPVWPQGIARPTEVKGIPNNLHWDEWIGPAPYRPYHEAYHPFKWRGFWDFGTGALGDMACHTMNMPFMALNLRDPLAVTAETAGHNQETYPGYSVIKYEFPGNDQRGPVTMMWHDGGKRPDQALFEGEEPVSSGCLVVGENGTLYSRGDYAEKDPQLLGGLEAPAVEFKPSPGHFTEWVIAIKGGEPATSNFAEYSGPLTETVLLGNLAVWVGGNKRVEWDAKKLTSPNMPELASFVKPEYRDGYTL